MAVNEYTARIREHVNECCRGVALVNAIAAGSLPPQELVRCARRHYAEVRTFIELKLPERLRLCPTRAYSAKRFFWEIYREEQGDFLAGRDHAELFKPVCHKLGISDDELEAEFNSYWPHYCWMLAAEPSYPVMIKELAVSYAWESFIINIGPGLTAALRGHYGFTDRELLYFKLHSGVDEGHSAAALDTLSEYVTDGSLEGLAREAITDSLIRRNYFSL
jgi:Iron-containing redox enzyme